MLRWPRHIRPVQATFQPEHSKVPESGRSRPYNSPHAQTLRLRRHIHPVQAAPRPEHSKAPECGSWRPYSLPRAQMLRWPHRIYPARAVLRLGRAKRSFHYLRNPTGCQALQKRRLPPHTVRSDKAGQRQHKPRHTQPLAPDYLHSRRGP